MGGVDCGSALDTKSSPHRAAIAKTQEELRLEYDVREERRRELEFLEKGGNPLDYKFGRVASISVQSTSLRDQLAEHETKGSFALAASPHGDSAESSGRPTCSLGREPNIADNLLLFTGENSSPVREKITKRTGKRSNVAPAELSSKIDGCRNLKEPNDLVIFRRGPRGQAYARRNRSRSNWDSHINTFPLLPSPCMNDWDAKESHEQVPTEEHAFSSLTNSKSTTPIAKRVQKSFGSKDQLCMDIDGEPTRYQIDTERPGLQVININSSENLKDLDHNATSVDQVAKSNFVQTSALIEKDSTASDGIISVPFCAIDNIKGSDHDENEKNLRSIDVVLSNGHENNITGEENVFNTVNEVADRINPDLNFSSVSKAHFYGTTDGGNSLTIASPATYAPTKDETITLQAKFTKSVEVKDAAQLRAQAEEDSFSGIEIIKNNMPNNSQDDETDALRAGMINVSSTSHNHRPSSAILSQKVFSSAAELQNSEANQLRLAKRADEDDILKQAQMVEATLKRAAVPSYSCISSENKKNWHWDFVLQEMAWMANDFMQERLWKTTAAAQVCNWIASVGITKFVQENIRQKQRSVARTLAKAVMNFWSSVRVILNEGEASSCLKDDIDANLFKASNCSSLDAMKNQCIENDGRLHRQGIQTYALRLLHYLSDMSSDPILSEAPRTPDLIKDAGSFGVIWDDQQSEERLFYNVLPGAMRSYRELTESQRPYFKVEVCEASMCNYIADGSRGVALEEDVGETGEDILSGGFEDKFLSKFSHKKNNICQPKLHNIRYEDGTDLTYEPCLDRKSASHSVLIMGKRPSGILNDTAVPTKRTRTAARQRIISPFTVGSVGAIPVTSKTDVSSGDTSFQDEQSSRYGGSQPQKTLEVDSTVDFERFLSFESSDIPIKSKKKKKPKHFGYKNSLKHLDSKVLIVSDKASSYEQRLQVDYMVQQDQRDHTKKRCESRHFDSNGNIGFYGQNVVKKPKVPKRVESPEPFTRAGGSMPSPVASQMSNMSNSNKLIKIINNRDRGRKSKALKMAAGQSGYGIAWSTFEDQALVVLVHDMGLNWELVSDALNSTLHFKCIYRKALECKERHKFLMDKGAGDGADSAEDSGSSQPYPSTLPGIPKGSARQLFQRLQGPMEEDTMKSHFEKVILIGQRLHNCRTQDNKQQLRQIAPAHSSHVFVLSQACPNNLSGQILSPIDLSDAVNSNPDVVGLGYQGTHTNGFVIPGHQGSLAPVLTTSSANSVLQGSPNVVLGSGIPLTSPPLHTLPRDAQRYGVPRSSTLPVDEQKRLQQFSQNISGRNMQQSGISMTSTLPAGVDRGVRMLAGGNGMGMMCGVNHSMPIPRTGFQGASPTGCLNMVSSNNMLPSNVGIPNPMGAHSSAVSVSGNTMIRPRDSLQMLRTTEEQRQIMMQEIQLQASQGNTQALSPYNGLSAPFSNAPVHPPVQTIPVQQHQASHQLPQPHLHGNSNNSHIQGTNHSSSQQQSYIRFAKESPLQRIVPQTQHPYSSSNAMSSLQSNSQLSQQNQSTSPVNSLSSLQPQHKQQPMPGNPQTSSMMSNQIMKQRQRQHVQQQQPQLQSRNLQQSKQQVQQQAKLIKGLGRGSMLMHQNVPVDATQVGGRPTALNNQASEKLAVQQSQGFNHGNTGINSNSQQSSIQQKLYSLPHLSQSKQVSPMPHSDTSQTSIQAPPTHTIRPAHQSVQAAPTAPQQHQQQQQQQRQANQSPTNMQRIILSQDRHLNHDNRMQPANNEPVTVNHLTPSPLPPKTADSSSLSAAVSSAVHWKPELSFETSSTGEKAQLNTLPQESSTGNDAVKPISTHNLGQRQLSGTISIHGHGVGSQWQQQRLQPTPVPQPHHRQGAQGNLCTRPSKTGQ